MATYNGQQYGDGSWMEDAHWGSYKFFFTENNVVHNLVKIRRKHGRQKRRSLRSPLQQVL